MELVLKGDAYELFFFWARVMCSLFCFPRNVCFIQAAWRIMELIVEEALFAAGCWSILLRPLLCFRGTWACASLNFASVGWVGCSCALRFMLYPRNMLPSWHSWYLGSVFCHVLEFQLHIWMLRRGLPCWNLEHYGNLFLLPRFCEFVLGSELSMLAADVVSSPFNAVASLGVGQHLFAKNWKYVLLRTIVGHWAACRGWFCWVSKVLGTFRRHGQACAFVYSPTSIYWIRFFFFAIFWIRNFIEYSPAVCLLA